jgi:hypothetical protein
MKQTQTRITLIFSAVAVVLVLLAIVSEPRQVTPDAFSDLGEEFFPNFTDPNAARTLEVIEFDEQTGSARPFKVTFQGGRWTIPSHYDYPADGKDRLAETAASVIGITKDDFRTDNASDHAACGVIDPLDESVVELRGRGKRVTIKGENDVVLADLIIGKSYEDRENFHLVRVPGQKRVYGSLIEVDISTGFSDWIEADLLKVEQEELQKINLKDYSINETTQKVETRDELALVKEIDDTWVATDMSDEQEVDKYQMNNFIKALDELSIVGIRPKPEGLSVSLQQSSGQVRISTSDLLSLQSKGFYFTGDGLLRSNEGEMVAVTSNGVSYTLRFGEVAYGSGFEVSAGTAAETGEAKGPGENRYLMITTSFDETVFTEPPLPENTDFLERPDSVWTAEDHRMKSLQLAHDEWETNKRDGLELSDELNSRFAEWYYVISADSFHKLRLTRDDLLKDKPKPN